MIFAQNEEENFMQTTAKGEKKGMFSSKIFDSRIKSSNTTGLEKGLGYFAGPAMAFMAYYCIAGSYLTQFYTDVLGLTGAFITFMPLISKIVDALTNICMGRIIDKTRSRQGKARPWIMISGPILLVSGILLYAVPQASANVQILWVVFSYNLFFAFAFTIYNMSHTLMVPLSTRNTRQRDTLAIFTSTGVSMLPGLLVTLVMPVMINLFLGVGAGSRSNWLSMMSILSVFMLPATLIEYYFTKERVTEDTQAAEESSGQVVNISFTEQLKACFSNRYWLFIMGFITVYEVTNSLSTQTILYFSNWVMNSSIDSGMGTQMLINAIGQAPLGLGVIFLWPLVKKFGKQRVMQVGCGIGVVGCALALGNVLFGTPNLGIVLVGVVVKSFGALPITYILVAMLADTLDHVEWANRFRADGFTASIRTIVFTVGAGIAQTIILGGISALGYIVPADTTQVVEQPLAIRTFFALCFLGAPLVCNVIGFIFMFFFDVEKKLPKIHEEVTARHKAEAEARGEVYVSPEEKAAQEQAENDRIAEENRIRELKARCRKKGLDFATEEAKYQKALADKKAKAAAKKK